MVYNRFFFLILLRVLLLFGSVFTLSSIFLRMDLFFTQIIVFCVLIIQLIELTYFVNKTNYELSRFLAAIKDKDFSINFNRSNQARSFSSLNSSFTELIETFKELETEKEAQLHFLNQLINQIEFGIITFDEKDKIELINQQASNLLDIPKISNWKNIKNPNTKFLEKLLNIEDVKNQLIETKIGDHTRYFSVSITNIVIRESTFKIVSFQDIKSEIQQKEIEAWHKLIRILTHEIMNSVTPLVSLTETVKLILVNEDNTTKSLAQLDEENIQDINHAIDTIQDRSMGILKFVNDYRKLTKIPKPIYEKVDLDYMINSVSKLMEAEIKKCGVVLKIESNNHHINVDKNLIEQVLINLIKNSIEALEECDEPKMAINTSENEDYLFINVSDNGPGVSSKKIDRIFIPFYTTKKEGSGIGLSISRQIMNLHGGYLDLNSDPYKKTTFSLALPTSTLSL